MTWTVIREGRYRHVVPSDEKIKHLPTNCPCMPSRDPEDCYIVIHNSFDMREFSEREEDGQQDNNDKVLNRHQGLRSGYS